MELPKEVETKFKQVLQNEISIPEFEKWVYETPVLETCLPGEKYMELIEMDYKTITYYDIRNFIIEYIHLGEIETQHILSVIKKIRNREGDLAGLEKAFKAIHQYEFLEDIEFPYSHTGGPEYESYFNKWFARLTEQQQLIIIKYKILMFNQKLDSVIRGIESGHIRIEHTRGKYFEVHDDRNAYQYPSNLYYLTKEVLQKNWDLEV